MHAASRTELLDEAAAWREIEQTVAEAADEDGDEKSRIDRYIHVLSRIYSDQIGMPEFFDGTSVTRFERFVHAIPAPAGVTITRDLVKASIRRLDTRPVFASAAAH